MFGYPVAGVSASAIGVSEGAKMLKEYDVVINGYPTTVKLDEAAARQRGVWVDEAAAAPDVPETKQSQPKQNKMRKPRNKGA